MEVSAALRAARLGAGLSQAALARRARTSQSAIARYESGATAPTLSTLDRLLTACGKRLEEVIASPARRRPRTARSLVVRERDRLLASASRHGIRRVRLFGSAARRTDRAGSDVDLLVDLRPDRSLLDAIGFQQDAAEILGMPVDVATSSILKPHVRRRVIREAVPL